MAFSLMNGFDVLFHTKTIIITIFKYDTICRNIKAFVGLIVVVNSQPVIHSK